MTDTTQRIDRRSFLTGLGLGTLSTAAAGYLLRDGEEPSDQSERVTHDFSHDVSDWFVNHKDEEWQIAQRYLHLDMGREEYRLRHPTGTDEHGVTWEYQLIARNDLAMLFKKLDDERAAELTEKYGDARNEQDY